MTNKDELATTDAFVVAGNIQQLREFGQVLVKSGLLPAGIKTPEAAVVIILKGRELGLPPMQALSHVHVINGKPTLSAEVMMAMALQRGHRVVVAESTSEKATVTGQRLESPGKFGPEQKLTFSMEDARTAGVTGNQTWKKYPAAMLRARAISAFMRMFAPDVLMGASYVAEELGANVNEDGDIIDVESRTTDPVEPHIDDLPTPDPAEVEALLNGGEAHVPMITNGQRRALMASMKHTAFAKDADRTRGFISYLAGRELASSNELTKDEAASILDLLGSDEGEGYRADAARVKGLVEDWEVDADYQRSTEGAE